MVLAGLLYVLWTTLRSGTFKQWDEARVKHWDDAVKGSSAVMAALRRRLLDEAEVEMGGWVAGVYWDLEKFFDNIKPRRLVELLEEQGANLRIVAMAMQCHLAPAP